MRYGLKLLDYLSSFVLISFMVLVLLGAIVSSLFRYYLPQLENYQEEVLALINERSGDVQISAEKMTSAWHAFRPEFNLYGVQVKKAGWDDAIRLEKLSLDLDILKSIYHRALYFDYIEVASLDLLLMQDENRHWSLAGVASQKRQPLDVDKLLRRIWAVDELSIQRLHVQLQPYQGERVALPFLQVNANTLQGEKHVVAHLIDGNQETSKLILQADGEPWQADFSLRAYWQIKDFAMFDVLAMTGIDANLHSANWNSELWFSWQQQKLAVNAQLQLADVNLRWHEQALSVPQLSSRLALEYQQGNWQFWLPDLLLKLSGPQYQFAPAHIAYQSGHISGQLEQADLPELHALLQAMPLPEKLQQVLADLAPRGSVQHLTFDKASGEDFTLTADLDDVAVSPWHDAPGVEHVTGVLSLGPRDGRVFIDSTDFSMFFPHLYDEPMRFAAATGKVRWKIGDERLDVGGDGIQLDGEYGQARGAFQLDLPRHRDVGEPPRMSLVVGLRNGDARYRDYFIPKTLDEGLLSWLANNIHQAHIAQAAYIYHGPTIKATDEVRMNQLWLQVDDGRVSYLPGWPEVEQIQGQYLLDGRFSEASIAHAQTVGVNLADAQLQLFPDANDMRIRVTTGAMGKAAAAMDFLQSQALSGQMGHVLDNWQVSEGDIQGQVSVSSLLHAHATPPAVKVTAQLQHVKLTMPDYNVEFDDINGPLQFTLAKGLSSERLSAKFWNEPVQASIATQGSKGKLNTAISFATRLDMPALMQWSRQPVFAFMQGRTAVNGEVYYGANGAGLRLLSSLKGVDVSLPKPFSKAKDEERQLVVHLPFTGDQRQMTLDYGAGVNLQLRLAEQGIDAVLLNLGVYSGNFKKHKVVIGGQLLDASVEAWLDVVERYRQADAAVNGKDAAGNDWTLSIERLQIKQLQGYGQVLNKVSFDLFNTVAFWQVGIDHQHLKASLKIFEDGQPMQAHLQRVDLEFLSDKHEQSGIGFTDPTLKDFPAIDFLVSRLVWQGEDFGEWEFKLRSYPDHMALEALQSSVRFLRLGADTQRDAELSWTFGDKAETHLTGRFAGDNMADVLRAWGYRQEVNSRSAWFDMDVGWRGGPTDFAINKVFGKSRFQLEKGNFADAKSGSTDALKLIGILNMARLVRRLQLDFTDLTQVGLAYDSVQGEVHMRDGIFRFIDPLVIKGASSDIRLQGDANINTEQLDMSMGVTLPLASNLPWVVALAGGLPTAAGVYIVSKLLKEEVDKLSSMVYKVEGSFDDPQIKFMRLFDNTLPENVDLDEIDAAPETDVKPEVKSD